MLNCSQAVKIDPTLLPDGETAVQEYESNGGQLTVFSSFGEDPLQGNPSSIAEREAEFYRRFTDFSGFFHNIANGDYYLFREGVMFFIDISRRLSVRCNH